MQCIILAGGLGTRMLPFTQEIPKAMILVHEHPFVHYQLNWLSRHGVKNVVFCIGYKGQIIRDYVGDGSKWGISVSYADEGQQLRGTGGALKYALSLGLLADRFFVFYGDSFLPIDFAQIWTAFVKSREPALMTVLKNLEKWDTSNVCYQGGKITLYDKWVQPKPPTMTYIDYGLSVFSAAAIDSRIPSDQKSDLADLFKALSLEGKLAGFEVYQRFYEIGSQNGLEDFKRYIASDGKA